jgi:hypothetical protein
MRATADARASRCARARVAGRTCILPRTAPSCTVRALGGMQARSVTSPNRPADMGSSGPAMLKSHPGISGDSRSDLHKEQLQAKSRSELHAPPRAHAVNEVTVKFAPEDTKQGLT